ncbi:MAG: HD-GYP domain-containing protein [Bacteriovoracaceae bacterium]|nr:HD-GYP domain-containing protein [Bacteriovoracaceae bacterium]
MSKKNNVIQLSAVKKARALKLQSEVASKNGLNIVPAVQAIKKEYFELTIKSLLSALKCKDDYTWGHSLRVAYFCVSVGKELGLSEDELYELEVSALFHDLGKIGVPDSVLTKPSRLTDEEFLEMKLHPNKSYEILKDFPVFDKMAINAKYHHERFDGRGYPEGLKGESIPFFSRIILIADTFDAMTSTRPYRKGLPFEVAFAELREFAGSQFDPHIVEKFISSMTKEQSKNESTFTLQVITGDFKKDAA